MTTSLCSLFLSYFLHAFIPKCIPLRRQYLIKIILLLEFLPYCLCLPKKPFFVVFGLIAALQEYQKIVAITSEILKAYVCRLLCSKLVMIFYSYHNNKNKNLRKPLDCHSVDPYFALNLTCEYIRVKNILFSLMYILKLFIL